MHKNVLKEWAYQQFAVVLERMTAEKTNDDGTPVEQIVDAEDANLEFATFFDEKNSCTTVLSGNYHSTTWLRIFSRKHRPPRWSISRCLSAIGWLSNLPVLAMSVASLV